MALQVVDVGGRAIAADENATPVITFNAVSHDAVRRCLIDTIDPDTTRRKPQLAVTA